MNEVTLRAEKARLLNDMSMIVDATRSTPVTGEQRAEFDRIEARIGEIDVEVRRVQAAHGPLPVVDVSRDAARRQYDQPHEQRGGTILGVEARSLLSGTVAASGGYLAPEQHAAQVWDKLRSASVGLASGFTVIDTDKVSLALPLIDTDAAASWTSEGDTINSTDPAFGIKLFEPKALKALVAITNEILADSSPSILAVVEQNLIAAMALQLDRCWFEGTGGSQPLGLKGTAGIQSIELGTDDGAVPTGLGFIADAIGLLAEANAEATACAMHPRTWRTLLNLTEAAGSNKPLLAESAGAPTEGIRRSILGVPVFLTSQLSTTETVGESDDCSSVYLYNAAQVIVARRTEVQLAVDKSVYFDRDALALRAVTRVDVGLPRPEAVVRVSGVRAATP